MKLNGIYTALITPYSSDYSINEQALEKVINKIIEEGCAWHSACWLYW
jgi:dihydrodipicolinate synthase/N-acetylneuraminate lyase